MAAVRSEVSWMNIKLLISGSLQGKVRSKGVPVIT